MLFEKIGLIDEIFQYRSEMYVGTKDDKIAYIGSRAPEGDYGETYDGQGKVLMPGFYNGHGHSPMSILRGYGEGLPLDKWLNERIFPFEAKLYGDAIYWATLLSMAESVRFGIVSTSDMYYFMDDMARAIAEAGTKSNISRAIVNFGTPVQENVGITETIDAIKAYHGSENGRIRVDACAHAEYTNDFPMLQAIAELAREYGVHNHIHLSETQNENEGCMLRHGMTPAQLFDQAGMFDQPTTAAHCTWLTENDREILRSKGVSVACCPASNMKLTSGMCNIVPILEAGINITIGTDGVASNNSLNYFEEMKLFALTGKLTSLDPTTMSPAQVLRSATRAGALAQGREDCGLVKEGFKADLIVMDASGPNMWPYEDMPTHLVYSADGKDICLTMADGKVLYKDGEYTTLDLERIYFEAKKAKEEILKML